MSRLNDLLRRLGASDPDLARDLRREVDALADRRSFGLNFERHVPEAVELPGRPVRKGDKVRLLPPRSSNPGTGDSRLWRVTAITKDEHGARTASLKILASGEEATSATDNLVVVAESRDPIYPGLVSTGKVERGGDKPFHTVVNAENYHALQTLLFTHRGKVDCVYIDPPYNTGAKDWKYNNDYVEGDDLYRHSKWLAFMERRLLLAKGLLDPSGSALIVSIDEKEYLRLGLLLEQVFPEGRVQMVSSSINATGVIRSTEFTRTNEYIFFVTLGGMAIAPEIDSKGEVELLWNLLQRRENASRRYGSTPRPDQFYPIYVNDLTGHLEEIGSSLPLGVARESAPTRPGCSTVFPMKPDGTEMVWGLTPSSLRRIWQKGYVQVKSSRGKYSVYYLTGGKVRDLEAGRAKVVGRRPDGSAIAVSTDGSRKMPMSQWDRPSHNAQSHGTKLVSRLIPGRRFPFPKSLYAVEDCLRFFVAAKPEAVVVDFFSGSGTTAHAVARLNRQDAGRRQAILITNNEVSPDEQAELRKKGARQGDPEWEALGIYEFITKPRIQAAIAGLTPAGEPILGDYKFTDESPISDGLEENIEFFTLTYEAPLRVSSNREFARIAPLLWLRAGSRGRRVDDIAIGWDVADTYGVLSDLNETEPFVKAVKASATITYAFIVTDEDRLFETVVRELPEYVEPVRLYEAYLRNFEIETGRSTL